MIKITITIDSNNKCTCSQNNLDYGNRFRNSSETDKCCMKTSYNTWEARCRSDCSRYGGSGYADCLEPCLSRFNKQCEGMSLCK